MSTKEMPTEILDLVRFLCETYTEIDKFVYKNCDADSLGKYPVIQGTSNQINLLRIGEQKHNKDNLQKAVKWMLKETG